MGAGAAKTGSFLIRVGGEAEAEEEEEEELSLAITEGRNVGGLLTRGED